MEIKYKSIFEEEMNNMILYEISMNFKNNNKIKLYDLDFYFIHINKKDKSITKQDFNNYIYNFSNSNLNMHKRYLIILSFCKFLLRFGNTNVFYEEINFENNSLFKPHIYTKKEMNKFFSIIDNKTFKKTNFNFEYPVLFRLLYSTGMRISEALNLKFSDIDLNDNVVNIIVSKENISRKIYISNSMKKVFMKYFQIMQFNANNYIFTTTKGNALYVFKKVVNSTNIPTNSIRLHDLRHSFAVTAFDKMIRMNIEPEEALLYLEKYLGHSSISSTEYYLHMTDNMQNEIISNMNKKFPNLYPNIKAGEIND